MTIEASKNYSDIGTSEQEHWDDYQDEVIRRVKLNINEICKDSVEGNFWVDTRSILSSLSNENIPLPASFRQFHNRTTWIRVAHREEDRSGKKDINEQWKFTLDSISGIKYPRYEFSIEHGQEPKIEELIRSNNGDVKEVLRTGVPTPSDLLLLDYLTRITEVAVGTKAITSTISIGKPR